MAKIKESFLEQAWVKYTGVVLGIYGQVQIGIAIGEFKKKVDCDSKIKIEF